MPQMLNHVMLILVSDYNSTTLSFLVTRQKGEPGAGGVLTEKRYYMDRSDQVGLFFEQASFQLVNCKYFNTSYYILPCRPYDFLNKPYIFRKLE